MFAGRAGLNVASAGTAPDAEVVVSADLIEWAAYSPKNTQLLVRALTSPAPGMAIADLMRTSGLGEVLLGERASAAPQAGTPPPRLPSVIGAPPP